MATPDKIPTEKRQLFISDGTEGAGRFKFACFVSSWTKNESRPRLTNKLRDCADPARPPVTVGSPGAYAQTMTLNVVAVPSNPMYVKLSNAIRMAEQLEYQDKIDLSGANGGGAHVGFVYVTAAGEEMPEEGTVTRSFTVEVEGMPVWTAAA